MYDFTQFGFTEEASNAVTGILNFTRCERADGTVYGTGGQCRKGNEIGDKEKEESKKTGIQEWEKANKEFEEEMQKDYTKEAEQFGNKLKKMGVDPDEVEYAKAGYLFTVTDPLTASAAIDALYDATNSNKNVDIFKLPKKILKEYGVTQEEVNLAGHFDYMLGQMKPVNKTAILDLRPDELYAMNHVEGGNIGIKNTKVGETNTNNFPARMVSPGRFMGLTKSDVNDIVKGDTSQLDDVLQGRYMFIHQGGVREVAPGVYMNPTATRYKVSKIVDDTENLAPYVMVVEPTE